MEKNLNPDISKINMETSKKAAESLENWAGVNERTAPNSSSFNGATSQMIKESKDSAITPKTKDDTIFSFGLFNTVSALKNSSVVDLPACKIMLEKYEFLMLNKNVPEAFLIEGLINDLQQFSWVDSINPILENLKKIYDYRRREIEVLKIYENIKHSTGRDLFSDATDQMKNWLVNENRTSDSLIHGLKKFGFNPMVRELIGFLSLYENNNSGKLNLGYDNSVCEITNIYSPVHIDENETIFFCGGKFFSMNMERGELNECNKNNVPEELANKAGMIIDRDIRIEPNKISLRLGNNKMEVVFEGENKNLYFNGKKIAEEDLPVAISVATDNLLESANNKTAKAVFVAKESEGIIDLDFGKKIKSKIYEGVEANIFKINQKIYVQTVNPSMGLNKIYEANATQAIKIIKDFIKFDISESLTEFLEGEQAILSVMKNDKNETVKNIEILEGELRKIENVKKHNLLIAQSEELRQLQESIENELQTLKDKWNQINLEISKFETKPKEVPSINEEMGYPIDTDVRIKRNGNRGKIIGVDGNSKTYTILFKEGKTGEYFFSDVENLSDEVGNYDITTPEVDTGIETAEAANESKIDQEFAEAPDKKTPNRKDRSFMKKYKKFMSEAPERKSNNPIGKKDPGKDQKNSHIEEAPEGNSKGSKKFIENEKHANLAEAPGDHKRNGKKFIDDLNNAELSDAPGSKE